MILALLLTVACAPSPLTVVELAPGSFSMGSPEEEPGHPPEEALHTVTLTRGFLVGVHEVTGRQFRQRMGYGASGEGCDDCPAGGLSWHEAAAFTNALSEEDGLPSCYTCEGDRSAVTCAPVDGEPSACLGWRLPTEAEWEYAARAGDGAPYPAGGALEYPDNVSECDESVHLDRGGRLSDLAWYCHNAYGASQPVGTLLPNAWGLYDTLGNAAEWVGDAFQEDITGLATDPWVPTGDRRVFRGGSYESSTWDVRAGFRGVTDPENQQSTLGLRVVRSAG